MEINGKSVYYTKTKQGDICKIFIDKEFTPSDSQKRLLFLFETHIKDTAEYLLEDIYVPIILGVPVPMSNGITVIANFFNVACQPLGSHKNLAFIAMQPDKFLLSMSNAGIPVTWTTITKDDLKRERDGNV